MFKRVVAAVGGATSATSPPPPRARSPRRLGLSASATHSPVTVLQRWPCRGAAAQQLRNTFLFSAVAAEEGTGSVSHRTSPAVHLKLNYLVLIYRPFSLIAAADIETVKIARRDCTLNFVTTTLGVRILDQLSDSLQQHVSQEPFL